MTTLSRYVTYALPLAVFSMPLFASAAGINISAIKPYSDSIISLINTVFVPLLFAIAFLYFVYGVYKYFILGADSDSERETGRQFVLWSLIGFAVILSVWGLVNVLLVTFNIPTGANPRYPTL